MQLLTDCEILDFCHSSPAEREERFQRAVDNQVKPVFQLPIFELCHALHMLVKYYDVLPTSFRSCWAEICKKHIEYGEYFIHVVEDDPNEIFSKIYGLSYEIPDDLETPCDDSEYYWGHNKHLVHRMKQTYPETLLDNWWDAVPPDEISLQPEIRENSDDVILDTNNLIELLNQLPDDGFLSTIDITFPTRLSQNTQRKFLEIIRTYGISGKFIVPICTLEEALWVINKPINKDKYFNAQKVLRAIRFNRDHPLWNMFSIATIRQEIFNYILLLYERLESIKVSFRDFDDFGDILVLGFGLYHGCNIATNEWFEGKPDIWDMVGPLYPFLVLEKN